LQRDEAWMSTSLDGANGWIRMGSEFEGRTNGGTTRNAAENIVTAGNGGKAIGAAPGFGRCC